MCVRRKHITYIQTWHGTPLKKLALDMDRMDMGGSTDIENYHEQFRVTCKDWDYLVSQNKFSTDISDHVLHLKIVQSYRSDIQGMIF